MRDVCLESSEDPWALFGEIDGAASGRKVAKCGALKMLHGDQISTQGRCSDADADRRQQAGQQECSATLLWRGSYGVYRLAAAGDWKG